MEPAARPLQLPANLIMSKSPAEQTEDTIVVETEVISLLLVVRECLEVMTTLCHEVEEAQTTVEALERRLKSELGHSLFELSRIMTDFDHARSVLHQAVQIRDETFVYYSWQIAHLDFSLTLFDNGVDPITIGLYPCSFVLSPWAL